MTTTKARFNRAGAGGNRSGGRPAKDRPRNGRTKNEEFRNHTTDAFRRPRGGESEWDDDDPHGSKFLVFLYLDRETATL